MDTDRRTFLIGAGSLITTSFIGRARDYIERTAGRCCWPHEEQRNRSS